MQRKVPDLETRAEEYLANREAQEHDVARKDESLAPAPNETDL